MNQVLETNVFFFISALSSIVLTIFGAIALYYLIGILRNVRAITETMREGTDAIAEDIERVRETVLNGGKHVWRFFSFLQGLTGGMSPKKKPTRRRRIIEEDDDDEEGE